MGAMKPLVQETKDALRDRFTVANDTGWVLSLAATEGWERANRSYLEAMRQRGGEEMAALVEAAGIGGAGFAPRGGAAGARGGGGGIRTPGGPEPTAVFKTAPFNHSAPPPRLRFYLIF